MSNARILLCVLLLGLVTPASSTIAQDANDPLAQPRPLNQAGFPDELYGWATPPDNPQTPAKVALGKQLFFDKRPPEDNTQMFISGHYYAFSRYAGAAD
jgi:cytochrome c peroxidase